MRELQDHQVELQQQNAELHRIQLDLAKSRARYMELYDQAPVGIFTLDPRGAILESNQTAASLMGVSRSTLEGRLLSQLVSNEGGDTLYHHRARLFETGEPQICELCMRRGGDALFWARLESRLATGAGSERVWQAVMSDVTEHRRAAEALRASDARHRILFEQSRDALMTVAPPSWGFTSANAATVAMFGCKDAQELLARTPWEYSPERQPDGRPSGEKAREMIEEAMRKGTHFFEWTHRRLSGEEFAATVLLTRLELDGQPMLQATVRDETEKVQLHARAAQADRLTSMGMVAASVAHEINNPLAYVLCNLEGLVDELPRLGAASRRCAEAVMSMRGSAGLAALLGRDAALLQPETLESIAARAREALEGIHRIRDVAAALGTFERVGRAEQTRIDVLRPVQQAINMALPAIKFRARLETHFEAVPAVVASEGKLAQVVLNLLLNAAQAMGGGELADNCIEVRTRSQPGEAWIEISDTGVGIPSENLERVFEPFFTTKPLGEGSGLGLSICRSIIGEFGGSLQLRSTEGRGSTFSIRLPAAAPDQAVGEPPPATAPGEPGTAKGRRGRLLVIDDEAAICRSLERALGQDHDVITVTSARAAQEVLQRDRDFDLILCDIMMPGMSGMELHVWIKARDPALGARVVFVTGGVFTPSVAQYLAGCGNARIDKPFDLRELEQLIATRVTAPSGH